LRSELERHSAQRHMLAVMFLDVNESDVGHGCKRGRIFRRPVVRRYASVKHHALSECR
jgi:hypothetical protein